jgi:hypothetical protein
VVHPAATAVHSTTAAHTATVASLPQPVTDVTSYGAVGDGTTDNGAAVRAALSAAQQVGGTLYFPAGHYLLSALNNGGDMSVNNAALTIAGAGAGTTTLTGVTASAPILAIRHDNVTVQDLTLDAQSHDNGATLYLVANYATIQRDTLLGGSHFFAIYAAGDAAGVQGNTGNQLLDDTVNDWTQSPLGDGISWSYQHNSLISNLNHTGSRLALYRDTNVTVNSDTFHPSTRTVQADVTQGYWISSPSDSITINNFTSYGTGGRMSANNGVSSTNITINNERMLGSGAQLRIDGVQGLTISGCDFGKTNTLAFVSTVPMSGAIVQNCSSLPTVMFWDTATVGVTFTSDAFPASTSASGTPRPSFIRYGRTIPALATVTVSGGSWANQSGTFSKGGPFTFLVTSLLGYS